MSRNNVFITNPLHFWVLAFCGSFVTFWFFVCCVKLCLSNTYGSALKSSCCSGVILPDSVRNALLAFFYEAKSNIWSTSAPSDPCSSGEEPSYQKECSSEITVPYTIWSIILYDSHFWGKNPATYHLWANQEHYSNFSQLPIRSELPLAPLFL